MRSLLVTMALGWCLAVAPARAQTPPAPPPTPTADFSAYDSALSAGRQAAAADELLKILDDPAQRALHASAWIKMAELMEGYGFKVAAVHAWSQAIQADLLVASPKLSHAIDLAEAVGDDAQLASVFANNLGAQVDNETRSRMAFLAARDLLRRDELGAAAGLLPMVDKKSSVYLDAELLRGVVLSMQGKHGEAVGPMLAAQAIARAEGRGTRFDEVVAMNVARTYFAAENWTQAVFWFDKIPRSSDYWPEAAFEKGWAYFRADDMQGTLATLLNHESPFFDGWYFPEADLLRAYGEFMMCKFADASKSMDGFVARYTPVKAELDATLASMDANAGWADGVAIQDGKPTKLPAMILRDFAIEDRFSESRKAVASADDELSRMNALDANAIGPRAKGWVQARRDAIVTAEGDRVLGRARHAQSELADMLQGIEITRLDLLNLETQMYERAAATGQLDYGDKIGKLRELRRTRRDQRIWPFNGEFWADELGWYVIDARPDCPDAMAQGPGSPAGGGQP